MPDWGALWHSPSVGARVARGALVPLSLMFRAVVGARNAAYTLKILPRRRPCLPTLSVGNISVGGTGKTPLASWCAGQLDARGHRTAIVLRGYGADEVHVHRLLRPNGLVIVDPDRVRGVAAARQHGATAVVLDDAFQHRRIERRADIVLLDAREHAAPPWLLPAGPHREPLGAIARASLVIVTSKGVSAEAITRTVDLVHHTAPHVPHAVVRLVPGPAYAWEEDERAHALRARNLSGIHAVLVSAIGDPTAFERQMVDAGVRVGDSVRFPDHHRYTARDVAALARRAQSVECVVCTLKDAVKLGPQWPRDAVPLWYVSQRIEVEQGAPAMAAAFDAIGPPGSAVPR